MRTSALLPILLAVLVSAGHAAETFTPYKAGGVAQNVMDLWKDYDARKEPLDVQVVREWKADGVVTRYVTFKVGTFKGTDARIAAYYSFPDDGRKNAAFVWSHGGGQRAERGRGVYFAKQGFATVDINWLGREMEPGITENADWGNVDPTNERRGPTRWRIAESEDIRDESDNIEHGALARLGRSGSVGTCRCAVR